MSPEDLLSALRCGRGMMLVRDDYDSVVTFLVGYDAACWGGFLVGFQELIELKHGRTSDLFWSSLALQLRWPDPNSTSATEDEKNSWLLDLLDEF